MEDYDLSGYTLFERQSKFYNGFCCPYCFSESQFIDSIEVYKHTSYGMMFICKKCDAYVGCHNGTDKSYGTLAKKMLRDLRHQAHLLFDPLWKKKKEMTGKSNKFVRGKGYRWLAELLNKSPEESHIGYFNESECLKVIDECKKYYVVNNVN